MDAYGVRQNCCRLSADGDSSDPSEAQKDRSLNLEEPSIGQAMLPQLMLQKAQRLVLSETWSI